jgi:hypothetical protein
MRGNVSSTNRDGEQRAFRGAWWLPNPHLQTVWGQVARSRSLVPFERERLPTPDGDELILDHVAGPPDGPRLLILHGLEGSSYSVYAQGMAQLASARGARVTVMNFRSCARDPDDVKRWIARALAPAYMRLGVRDEVRLHVLLQHLALGRQRTVVVERQARERALRVRRAKAGVQRTRVERDSGVATGGEHEEGRQVVLGETARVAEHDHVERGARRRARRRADEDCGRAEGERREDERTRHAAAVREPHRTATGPPPCRRRRS